MATLGYREKEPWIHNHDLCYRVQMLCNGKTSPLLLQNCYFFLVQRAGWAVKWWDFTQLGHSASSWHFADRREVSQLCPTPAGHWPALNWKPSNNTLRACTVLQMRMLISASHFSVIQQWSSFFLFSFRYFLFSHLPLFLLSPSLSSLLSCCFGVFYCYFVFTFFFQVTKPSYAVIFL